MTKAKSPTKSCSRCKGQGYGSWVVIQGQCFKCGGRGWIYTDKFTEEMGGPSSRYVGIHFEYTAAGNHNVVKKIATEREVNSYGAGTVDELLARGEQRREGNSAEVIRYTVITEEQARAFFAKYGKELRRTTKVD
jgi:hypothetical protein